MDGRLIGGRYRLLEARAIGGSAAVWRALDERTGRLVAVKRLHPHLAGDEHAIERLRREATVMGAVEHPNVVPVRDIVVDADGPAIVMDYIDGRSLAEHLIEDGSLPEPASLRIATEVADGLAAAHAHGLVHRDVKPANILLGSDGRARITDFGIATEIDSDGTALTAADGVVGTMRYLAPERLAGEPAVPATDVWGLGAVLYEMLTGGVPYPATTIVERAESAQHVPPRPAGVAASTWAVIERALASDPSLRYPEAGSMAADLRSLQPIVAVPANGTDPWADTMVVPIAAVVPDPSVVPGPTVDASPRGAGSSGDAVAPGSSRGRRLAVVGALAFALVVGIVTINAGSAGADPAGAGAVAPTASASLLVPEATATVSPVASEPAPTEPDDNDKGKGGGKGKGNDD